LQLMDEQSHKSLKSFYQQIKNFELNYNSKITNKLSLVSIQKVHISVSLSPHL
jgi:hypothetical protein